MEFMWLNRARLGHRIIEFLMGLQVLERTVSPDWMFLEVAWLNGLG
jgi:hypothetical protein